MNGTITDSVLKDLVKALLSPNTEVIARAEQQTDALKKGALEIRSQYIVGLLHILRNGMLENDSEKQMDIVLLISAVFPDKDKEKGRYWNELPNDAKELLKNELINFINEEQSKLVIRIVVSLIGEIAEVTLPTGQWNSLFPFMFQSTQSKEVFYFYILIAF